MSLFFRIFQHLLPDAAAWRLTIQKMLRRFFEGLSEAPAAVRQFVDDVYGDRFATTTRELAEWERQFALTSDGDEATRRARLAAAKRAQGGQSPRYLQDLMQAAGFPVYIHEWWDPAALPTVTARNPHDYTEQPRLGSIQCRPYDPEGPPAGPLFRCREATDDDGNPLPTTHRCNRWLINETKYIVNLNLTREAPPPVPNDPATYPYFLYWSSADINVPAQIPAARRAEFEAMLKKHCPAQHWLGTNVEYV
jgi:hypothetical protein